MPALIDTLIEGQDGWELARDTVAAILAVEIASQKAQAVTASEDETQWDFEIFSERDNPIGEWTNLDTTATYKPIVNVWSDGFSTPRDQSTVTHNHAETTVNVDCYGLGWAKTDGVTGHEVADKAAALEAQRAARLVRRILLSEHYTYLGSARRAAQWCFGREVSNGKPFRPDVSLKKGFSAVVLRVTLKATVKEQVPQITGQTINFVHLEVTRAEDGKVLLKADYYKTEIATEGGLFLTTEAGNQLTTEA